MPTRYKLPVDFPVREAIANPCALAVVLPYLRVLVLTLWQAARRSASHF